MLPEHIDYIIVHCAATRPSMDIGASEIDGWHRERGFDCCGYHAVIRRDGTLEGAEEGCRPMTRPGAHCRGFNSRSIGVCLVGGVDEDGKPENNFTDEQMTTLGRVLADLRKRFPQAVVRGHRDMPKVKKACPSFDVAAWLAGREEGEAA
ncbi:N-acetylmuramoyl-L-alanine amidase [Desulfocurvus sp. DL9XJH121]